MSLTCAAALQPHRGPVLLVGPAVCHAKPLFSSTGAILPEVNKTRWQIQIFGRGRSKKYGRKEGEVDEQRRSADGWMNEWTDG